MSETTSASVVIERLGGYAAVAAMLGTDLSRVYRWTYPQERGGTGGTIPQRHHAPLLQAAADRGIALTPTDFLPPGTVPEAPAPDAPHA